MFEFLQETPEQNTWTEPYNNAARRIEKKLENLEDQMQENYSGNREK